jgi:hypothetical protein
MGLKGLIVHFEAFGPLKHSPAVARVTRMKTPPAKRSKKKFGT